MTQIARLRIALNDVAPQVLRQLDVPLAITLDRLHEVIQAAMGWSDAHLYEFRAEGISWGVPDPDWPEESRRSAQASTLEDVLAETGVRTLQYIYDFGDYWDHVLRVEAFEDATPNTKYPRLLEATGACPPEDVDGAPGYSEFVDVLADPQHADHEDILRWAGGSFDPNTAPVDQISKDLGRLAKKWALRSRKTN